MGRILALDVGDVRVGLAISDPMKIIASPLSVINRKADESDIDEIMKVVSSSDVELIVCGLPKRMDNQETIQTQKTREYAEKVKEKTKVKVVFVDERLTTASAERSLISGNVKREKRKNVVDKVAAAIILESYINGNF